MSIALCFGFDLSLAGQTITHRWQPVQSSGATWIEYCCPLYSRPLYGVDLKVGGAPFRSEGNTLARMAACGHTIAHLLHWMQIPGSQTGISSAIERFSHCAVAVGQVPSTGKAETGSRSPLPAIMTAVTRFTNSGAFSEMRGGRRREEVAATGSETSCRLARVSSTDAKLRRTTSAPFLP